MESLLDCSLRALARYLACSAPESDLREALAIVQRLELVQQLWATWQDLLQAAIAYPGATATIARPPPPPLAQQRAVLEAFAAACWRPQLLRLAYSPGPLPQGLASLPLVGQRLLHLELSAPSLWQLDAVVSACPQLCCLSLRGCTHLGDASLAALARCTSLRALDLSGLVALTDGAAFHVAHLPQLSALSLAGTAITDRALQLLTYGHKVRAWARAAGSAELPPEVAAWPAAPLEHLQVGAGLGCGLLWVAAAVFGLAWFHRQKRCAYGLHSVIVAACGKGCMLPGITCPALPSLSASPVGGRLRRDCRWSGPLGAAAPPAISRHAQHRHCASGAGAGAAPLCAAVCAGCGEAPGQAAVPAT